VKDRADTESGIAIEVVGKRPGEKLFEELFYDRDNAKPTRHPKIMRADASGIADYGITLALEKLLETVNAEDAEGAKARLFELISREKHRDEAS
jgi:FlaA1/EpsC-like NDP-sugar epimerase